MNSRRQTSIECEIVIRVSRHRGGVRDPSSINPPPQELLLLGGDDRLVGAGVEDLGRVAADDDARHLLQRLFTRVRPVADAGLQVARREEPARVSVHPL